MLSGGARSLWGADDASHAIVSTDASPAFPAALDAPGAQVSALAAPQVSALLEPRVPATLLASSESGASEPAPLEIPEIDAIVTKAVRAGRTPGAVVIVG